MSTEALYQDRYSNVLAPIAVKLQQFFVDLFETAERIDRISVRAKTVPRFVTKSEKLLSDGSRKYTDPMTQIQDQIGARIVCFYLSDVERIAIEIDKYLRPIEAKLVIPESEAEFGYFGKHYVLFLPDDVLDGGDHPKFFELQIKTLFQHAWSEAEHDLTYKPQAHLPADVNRKVAFTAAQAWGADMIFDELFTAISANDG